MDPGIKGSHKPCLPRFLAVSGLAANISHLVSENWTTDIIIILNVKLCTNFRAIMICITTVFALAWIDLNSGPRSPIGQGPPPPPPFASASKIDVAVIIAMTAILTTIVVGHFYRVFKFVS